MPEITYGRWSPTEVMERVLDGTWVAATPEEDGDATDAALMMVPTSIAYTGTSATTTDSGSVEFTAVSSLSLNGVFTGDFDNYMVVMRQTASSATSIHLRLRVGGADNSTANSYVRQYLEADSTTVGGARQTYNYLAGIAYAYNVQRAGQSINIYGPALTQPTAFRSVSAYDYASALITDVAGTHNQSIAYDGFTVYSDSYNITGLVSVYGIRGA